MYSTSSSSSTRSCMRLLWHGLSCLPARFQEHQSPTPYPQHPHNFFVMCSYDGQVTMPKFIHAKPSHYLSGVQSTQLRSEACLIPSRSSTTDHIQTASLFKKSASTSRNCMSGAVSSALLGRPWLAAVEQSRPFGRCIYTHLRSVSICFLVQSCMQTLKLCVRFQSTWISELAAVASQASLAVVLQQSTRPARTASWLLSSLVLSSSGCL